MPTVKTYQKQKEKEQIAYQYFLSQGYSPEATAGIVGNLVYESGLNTKARGDIGFSGGDSYGIAQFRGQRLKNLKNRYGDKWTDFNNQLDFVRHELETTHQKAGNILKNTKDVYVAGQTFSDLYEIPAKKYKNNIDRQKKVNSVYNSWSGQKYDPVSTPIADEAIRNANEYFNSLPTTDVKDLEIIEDNSNLAEENEETEPAEDEDIKEVQKQTAEINFLQAYKDAVSQPVIQEQVQTDQPVEQYQPQQSLTDIYNQVSNFIDSDIAQQGGRVDDVREFHKNYVKSSKYRERLDNSGYGNIDEEINQRYLNLDNVDINYKYPSKFKQFITQSTPPHGSYYDPVENEINMDYSYDLKVLPKYYPNLTTPYEREVRAHELSHTQIRPDQNTNKSSRLNRKDKEELLFRLKPEKGNLNEEHDRNPTELKADLDAYRYMLYKSGKYDAGKQDFNEKHLKNSKKSFVKDRLQEYYSDENIIWLMNNVAQNENIDGNTAQQGGTIQGSENFLQNWYQNRVLPDSNLNQVYQNEKQQYVNQSMYLPKPNYVNKIDDENTQGTYDIKTDTIDLLNTADPLVYTHEATHKINLPLKDTQSNVNAFGVIGQNIIPRENIENQWVKDNYQQISNYQEVIPRLQAYRQKYGLKPDQIITPELIQQNRQNYQNTGDFEDNTDQLYKLFEDANLADTLNKVVSTENNNQYYAQQGKLIDNLRRDFVNKPKQMYLPEGSSQYKRYKEQDKYFNPEKRQNITSGDWKQDLLYQNDWLINTPLIGDYIKGEAKKIATASGGAPFLNPEEVADSQNNGKTNYTGGDKKGVTLIDQYFSEKPLYNTAKYKPTSDYLEFLPTYSVKENFEKNPDKQKVFNQELTNFMFLGDNKRYNEFIKNKKPVYRRAKDGSEIADLLEVDLGGHKTGAAWDDEVNLPYVSVSDAWDFEPKAYSKKWDGLTLADDNKDTKENKEKSFIQSYLMHKAGNPFKIYDRFYFDPKTKKYIPDSEIDKLRPKKQEGGKIIKDNQGQRKHKGNITEIEGNVMATDGYGDLALLVKTDNGQTKIVEANTGEHVFPGATKFTEYPLTENEKEFLKHISNG